MTKMTNILFVSIQNRSRIRYRAISITKHSITINTNKRNILFNEFFRGFNSIRKFTLINTKSVFSNNFVKPRNTWIDTKIFSFTQYKIRANFNTFVGELKSFFSGAQTTWHIRMQEFLAAFRQTVSMENVFIVNLDLIVNFARHTMFHIIIIAIYKRGSFRTLDNAFIQVHKAGGAVCAKAILINVFKIRQRCGITTATKNTRRKRCAAQRCA